jgi:6-phosphogluconolactonase
VEGERPPEEAAQLYAAEIARFFRIAAPSMPAFDVLHLGIGADGHTASLFPDSPLVRDRERIAAAVFAPRFSQWRVTLLPGVLAAAANVIVLAAGADKREAIRAVLHEPEDPVRRPVQVVSHRAQWFLDRDAAGAELGDESAVVET